MDVEYLKEKRILLVDDEQGLLDMVCSILKEEGYRQIRTAGTVKEALEEAAAFRPELAILDVMLPDGDGFALFEKLKKMGGLTREDVPACFVYADAALLSRAAGNLIQNSMNHNPEGCTIYVTVEQQEKTCSVTIEDDGAGVTEEKLEELNNAPHYMMCDENVIGQRHGLGLLIVRQIAQVHGGRMDIGHSAKGGFAARVELPLKD